MAYRRKTTPRKTAPVRRRRRMGARVTAASTKAAVTIAVKGAVGGAAAAVLTNTVGKMLPANLAPWTGLLGSVATSLFLKQPEVAAGMAAYSGVKVASSLPGVGSLMAGYGAESNMYLQGYNTPGMAGSGIYASDYTLAGYDVPGL
jgi:hypothetical protein